MSVHQHIIKKVKAKTKLEKSCQHTFHAEFVSKYIINAATKQ